MHTHAIPSLGTLTQEKTKKQVQQELDSYFDELMRISTSLDLPISGYIMCKYGSGMATLKIMMCMLIDDLEKGARVVYPNAMEVRFRFHIDVTAEHMDTLKDYQSWHQYVTVDQHEDVKKLEFYGCLSPIGLSNPLFTWVHVHCNVESCQVQVKCLRWMKQSKSR